MEDKSQIDSVTPPKYSIATSFKTIGKKGIVGALEDREQGPHVHLTLLLITVVLVSLGIIVISRIL